MVHLFEPRPYSKTNIRCHAGPRADGVPLFGVPFHQLDSLVGVKGVGNPLFLNKTYVQFNKWKDINYNRKKHGRTSITTGKQKTKHSFHFSFNGSHWTPLRLRLPASPSFRQPSRSELRAGWRASPRPGSPDRRPRIR